MAKRLKTAAPIQKGLCMNPGFHSHYLDVQEKGAQRDPLGRSLLLITMRFLTPDS